jgi:hypothetical protein
MMGVLILLIFSTTALSREPIVQRAWEQLEAHVRDLSAGQTRQLDAIEKWGYPEWVFNELPSICITHGYACDFRLQSTLYALAKENDDRERERENTEHRLCVISVGDAHAQWEIERDSKWFYESFTKEEPDVCRLCNGGVRPFRGPIGYMSSYVTIAKLPLVQQKVE